MCFKIIVLESLDRQNSWQENEMNISTLLLERSWIEPWILNFGRILIVKIAQVIRFLQRNFCPAKQLFTSRKIRREHYIMVGWRWFFELLFVVNWDVHKVYLMGVGSTTEWQCARKIQNLDILVQIGETLSSSRNILRSTLKDQMLFSR